MSLLVFDFLGRSLIIITQAIVLTVSSLLIMWLIFPYVKLLQTTFILPFLPTYVVGNRFAEQAIVRITFLIVALLLYGIWQRLISKSVPQEKFNNYGVPITSTLKAYLFGAACGLGLSVISYGIQFSVGIMHIGNLQITWYQFFINLLLIFIFSTATSIGEELLFRRCIFKLFLRYWNVHIACIVQACIFGFFHIRTLEAPWLDNMYIVLATGMGGLFYGYLYLYCNNLAAPIGAHTSNHLMNILDKVDIKIIYSYPIFYYFRRVNGIENIITWLSASILLIFLMKNKNKRIKNKRVEENNPN